ncbi:MAG: peptide ABC transporter substrate-binding protein [Patescibacteria group bacterium]|nr:peptide ABC transporter substrate-binding protein [Patescibacteria group bacterium]
MFNFFIRLFKSFSKKEFLVFLIVGGVFLISSALALAEAVIQKTKTVAVGGGDYTEGIVGQPSFVNPILANSDADRDLVKLTFSDLKQLAESYKVDEKGKIWHYRLKDGVKWQDGEKITSDDIIFTIETIQNPDVYSPIFQNWQGVVVKRISEREVEFDLPAPYAFFKAALEDLRPAPKHIFAKIPTANLKLSDYNLNPIASGPYKVVNFKKQSDGFIDFYLLERNENYSGDKAYLKKFKVVFYGGEDELISAFNNGEIDGFGLANVFNLDKIVSPHEIFPLKTLKYYAVFFNSYSHPALKEKNIRMVLDSAINKNELVDKIFKGYASPVYGPLLSANQFSKSVDINEVLDKSGWLRGDDGIRQKTIGKELVKMEFTLVAPQIQILADTAELIKQKWEEFGIKTNVSIVSLSEINNEIIKTRNYQMIIFGNILGKSPDLYSFWHSSEKFYPGLNLSLYENKSADRLIESIRENFDEEERTSDLEKLQSMIVSDYPAIFLYSPDYLYVGKKKFYRFESSGEEDYISFAGDRFNNVEKWYVETTRVLK